MTTNLFGNMFDVNKNNKVKTVSKKSSQKSIKLDDDIKLTQLMDDEFEIKVSKQEEVSAEKLLKSKHVSIQEKLDVIKTKVLEVLGKQKDNILVIKSRDAFHDYITKCIETGRIAVDTETDNSLDPITCKIMGLCLYSPGLKQAYIPINHRDPETKEKLSWQCTEQDIKEELQRIIDAKTLVIMHNGKFDYSVIKCTCGIAIKPDWDTMVAARLLNENERAGLKEQYVSKIDKIQEKYHIDDLFTEIMYADVDPDIFAFYAATDSLMTDKLYELQVKEFEKEEYGPHLDVSGKNQVKGLRWLFHEVEMPIVIITAEMELTGVRVDQELGQRLLKKYTEKLNEVDSQINDELDKLKNKIDSWKLSKEANEKTKVYPAAKTKMTAEKIEQQYPNIDEDGNRYKVGKAKIEQIEDPINLASPVQLAILFYDILKAPQVNKTNARATGEEELEAINKEMNLPICKLLLERRGIMKLLTTYIETIPTLTAHWPDGRIRFHLNPLGTDTGRFSSGGRIAYSENDKRVEVSGINIQNIPSHCNDIRLLFTGDTKNHQVELTNNYYEVPETDEVLTTAGWKKVQELMVDDVIVGDDNKDTIINIVKKDKNYLLYINV